MSFLPIDRSSYRKRTLLENLARLGGDAPLMYEEEQPPIQDPNVPMGQSGFEATGQSEPAEVPHLYFDPQKAWDAEQSEEVQQGKRMSEAYKPQTTANDRFEALLNNYPERDKPSFMRKLSASLVGFGGDAKGAQAIIDRPFNRKRDVWEDQTKGAYQAANLERYENVNQRSLLAQEERANNADRRTDEYIRRGEAQTKLTNARTAALEFKRDNPTLRMKMDGKSGNLFAVNADGSFNKWVTLPDGTPASGRDLSFEERQNILQDDRKELIKERDKVHDDNVANKPEEALTPSAQRTAKQNRAEAFVADHPDLASWIDKDSLLAGDVVITPPDKESSGFFGLGATKDTTAIHKAIVDHIVHGRPFLLPSQNATPKDVIGAAKNQEIDSPVPPIRRGVPSATKNATGRGPDNPVYPSGPKIKDTETRIVVISPHDGKEYDIPAEQKDKAIAKGYTVKGGS